MRKIGGFEGNFLQIYASPHKTVHGMQQNAVEIPGKCAFHSLRL